MSLVLHDIVHTRSACITYRVARHGNENVEQDKDYHERVEHRKKDREGGSETFAIKQSKVAQENRVHFELRYQ